MQISNSVVDPTSPARAPRQPSALLQLLFAQAFSQAGFTVMTLALPLLTATVLKASPFQVSMVSAAQTAAFLLIGLPAGVWVDRMSKRRVMIAADLLRSAALALVPLLWVLKALNVTYLCVVALAVGAAAVFFDVANQSYLPTLVPADGLVAANARLVSIEQTAAVAGPGVAGLVVQAVSAPLALIVTAVTYLGSALFVRRIADRPEPTVHESDQSLARSVAEGLRFVLGHPLLRPLVACSTTMTLCWSAGYGMLVVLLAQNLHIPAATIGLLFAAGGLGGVSATFVVKRLIARLGDGRAVVLSVALTAPCTLLAALAGPGPRLALVAAAQFAFAAGLVVYNVAQVSYRQRCVPPGLLGRVNATVRFFAWGARPLGMLAGGSLADLFGVRSAVWVGAAGTSLAVLWLLFSPLRGMRVLRLPDAAPTDPGPHSTAPANSVTRSLK